MWAFIDVDGTLIDADDNPRPYIHGLFSALRDCGYKICVWSAGGSNYAARQVNRLNLPEDYIDFIGSKGIGTDDVKGHRLYIDDARELITAKMRQGHWGYVVPFYNQSTMGKDRAFIDIVEDVRKRHGVTK